MSFETPNTLVELRTALRERCQLDANDPANSDAALNRLINAAIHRFSVANPNGWPWDYVEVASSLAVNQETLTLAAAVAAGVPSKVRYVILQHVSGLWEYPLERVTRADQLERYPNDSERGAPRVFSLMGDSAPTSGFPRMLVKFRPACDLAYSLVIGLQAPLDDLAADSDPAPAGDDHSLDVWSSSVLEYAAFLVYRAREELAEALLGAKDEFDAGVLQQRRTARSTVGAGISIRPLADDRELQ